MRNMMRTTLLIIAIISIVIIIGLIVTNSNQDKNGSTESAILDTDVNQRSESKPAENLSSPSKSISSTLSLEKDKALLDTSAEKEPVSPQPELIHPVKKKPASEIKRAFIGNNNDNNPVNELEQAFYQDDISAIETAIDIAAQCPECFPRLKEILEDEGADNQLRVYAAQALIKSGEDEAAIAVLKEIVNANALEYNDLEDGLKQAFVQLDSVEAAKTLIAILLNEEELALDAPIPDNIEYMVSKVIRKMSDRKAIADNLTQQYHNASTPEQKRAIAEYRTP
ncbi:membrane or secreted protein [Beggiatoa sp. PS]|nr:membrane or secreted protein [Beggiatoa sp. PS]